MTETEKELIKKLTKKLRKQPKELKPLDREFIELLGTYSKSAPIRPETRIRLYEVGKLFGYDGREMFVAASLKRAKR